MHSCKCCSSEVGAGPSGEAAALRGNESWQSGTKKCHKVIPHNKAHSKELVIGKDPGGVGTSAWARSHRDLSRRQTSYRDSWGQGFLGWRLVDF